MLNERQSFLVSLTLHLGLVLVLLIAGALVARRIMGPKPIELDLMAPVEVGPEEEAGAPEQPEAEPEIVEREVEEPTYNPDKSLNLDNIPDVEREEFKPYKPEVTAVGAGTPSSPEARYLGLVVAACKHNWEKTKPSRGVLGSTVPTLRVVITIRRDGRYVSHRITRSSGIAAVDRSVDEAIRRADPFPAFPREMTGAQQDFEIEFVLEH